MAHPPIKASDLSLELFLTTLLQTPSNIQVVKLDFKSIDILEPSLKLASKLQGSTKSFPFELWLNADILASSEDTSKEPLNANLFLQLCHEYFANQSNVTLSPGFVTDLTSKDLRYSMENMKAMYSLISKTTFKSITYPLRALYLSHSKNEIFWLMQQNNGKLSTVTLWGQDELNSEEIDNLRDIISKLGRHKFYLDVDENLLLDLLK